jgi:hypothetical protein
MTQADALALPFDNSNPHIRKFIRQIENPILLRFFMLAKLPSAFFMGLKVQSVNPKEATVQVPYKWRSQNPFKSIYFAAQAAAAEMSTGVLAMLALQGRGNVSMLVTKMEANYSKKANKLVTFTCKDGEKVIQAIREIIETGESREVTMQTTGTQINDEGAIVEVSRFTFTWSFKQKK